MKRRSGVLMAVSSLPSDYGIGDLGLGAYRFVDRIAEMGFSLWQVLPLNCPDMYGSPYTSISAFAASPLYISPDLLVEEGLISARDAESAKYGGSPYTADYEFAEKAKEQLLRKAFMGLESRAEISDYARRHEWVKDYALYCTLKGKNGGKLWNEWPAEERDYSTAKAAMQADEADYYIFCQYVFEKQWQKLRSYAKAKGVEIVGDMPIYVSFDSADVWSNIDCFKIDKKTFEKKEAAAVPPDYFSEKGQLWGNPIYDWDALKSNGFAWWKARIARAMELYDIVRIDHFRGLASYYSVAPDAEDAINGEWHKGPGLELFEALGRECSDRLIAEDLGVFGEDVAELLAETGLPGMRVVQFGFSGDRENTHLPHNYPKNSVAYVGTHDNSTILGWLWEAEASERRYLLDYCGFSGDWGRGGYDSPACRKVIETVWRSCADISIVAFQDMCGFGNDARMNVPGEAEKSWKFRTTLQTINEADCQYFLNINRLFSRTEK
ncbi:MAG: 4-alpha-glucanotransferase [Clostridia bacterium]|nr:4-alpha-glucanotransferase [Clostridia bacterium]